jgi:hypothetical protein
MMPNLELKFALSSLMIVSDESELMQEDEEYADGAYILHQ